MSTRKTVTRTTLLLGLLLPGFGMDCGGATNPDLEDYVEHDGAAGYEAEGAGGAGGTGHAAGGSSGHASVGGTTYQEQGGSVGVGGKIVQSGGSGGFSKAGGGGKAGSGGRGGGGSAGRGGSAGKGGALVDGGLGGRRLDGGPDAAADGHADAAMPFAGQVAGKEFLFVRDRVYAMTLPDGAPRQNLSWFAPETDYQPIDPQETYLVTFSADASSLTLKTLELDGSSLMSCNTTCTLNSSGKDIDAGMSVPNLYYTGPMGPASGRMLVWQTASDVQAEVLQEGSGVPIIYSWRGKMIPW